jgi:hypothetical protein
LGGLTAAKGQEKCGNEDAGCKTVGEATLHGWVLGDPAIDES